MDRSAPRRADHRYRPANSTLGSPEIDNRLGDVGAGNEEFMNSMRDIGKWNWQRKPNERGRAE